MDPIEDSPDLQKLIELWYAFLLSHNCDIDFQFMGKIHRTILFYPQIIIGMKYNYNYKDDYISHPVIIIIEIIHQ